MAGFTWARLQRVLESVAPGLPRGGLNPPATESQVAAVERLVGCRLPEDLREAYRHFNGMTRPDSQGNGGPQLMLPFYDWCDLESMARRWTSDREHPMPLLAGSIETEDGEDGEEGPVPNLPHREAFQDPGWLPIGLCNMSPRVCVDMNPSPLGRPGQLILVDFEAGGPSWMAACFEDHVVRLLDVLEGGALQWRSDGYFDRAGSWVTRLPNAPERP
jgi:cell wall assembly regulator SMI1